MKLSILDRLLSVLAYYTFGIFALVLLLFYQVTNRKMGSFLLFNILQSIFIATILGCFTFIYSFFFSIINRFDIAIIRNFDLFINHTPVFFTYTLTGLLVMILISYLGIFALFGKKPFVPYISDIINVQSGGR